MLACKWIEDGDPRGAMLLAKLKQIIPSFKLSSPDITTVTVRDLRLENEMVADEANQWERRMIGVDPELSEVETN